jgi:hypothetical protein
VTFTNRDLKANMARCSLCDADLITSKTGKVFCTNLRPLCKYVKAPHPTGPEPNAGTSSLRD